MKLSIVLLNYNTKELTENAIQAVLKTVKTCPYEIFLVDNDSSDGSQKEFKEKYKDNERIKLIFNNENGGFAKGNNIALKMVQGEYILLLNTDTIVKEGCIDGCLEYIDKNSDIGAIGPKILLGNGQLDHACKRGFPTPSASLYYMLGLDKKNPECEKYGKYRMTYLDDNEIGEVDALTGAFMMVRKSIIDKIGMLDERFFMFAEDIDWCYRIKEEGYKIIYYPKEQMIHLKGQSSRKKRRYKTIYQFHKTMIQFYNKHYLKKYNFLIAIIVYIGIGSKLVLSFMKNMLLCKRK